MDDWLAARFEENRGRLRAMAYRMLGSLSEADDAVQETWLRVSRAGASGVENPGGWLTTVAARVCLNMLRERRSRREEPLSDQVVGAFLAASRDGNFDALLALLDPDVVARADAAAPAGAIREVHGARAVAEQALMFSGRSRHARQALVDGAVGIVVAPHGRLVTVLTFVLRAGKVTEIDILAEPARLRELRVAVLDG